MSNLADGLQAVLAAMVRGLEPDPDMWIDDWAEAHMIIPKGAEPGRYRNARTPYARAVMRALSTRHPCKRVVVRAASQMLKTQCGLNWIAASIHQAPANILVLLPTLPLAKRVSSRISDTIKAVPALRERVAEPRSRDARNTIDTKEFPGGAVIITTAGSASNLSEIPARYIYCDEVDRWERSVDGEGDPIKLSATRASTYEANKKLYYTSSPTFQGLSKIDDLYAQGDQQQLHVHCPHCKHPFVLTWEHIRHDDALTRAWAVCPDCGAEIEERNKTTMLAGADWVAQAAGDGETLSFELSALYMPLGWVSWLTLAREYADAARSLERGDQGPMQVFWNTRLAKSWDSAEERTSPSALQRRAEPYPPRTAPSGALVLTCAVDVQGNRLELLIIGWGAGLERWVIDYQVLWGSPAQDAVWADLDALLRSPIQHASGQYLRIACTLIDSGGHNTQDVYDFVRTRRHRKVYAIKGASKPNRPILSTKPSKVDINHRGRIEKQGAELWFVGTDVAKDWIYARYKLASGPGAIHFHDQLPDTFYAGAVAERKIIKYWHGYSYSEYFKNNGEANEPLDLLVYNLAAAHFLGLQRKRDADWEMIRHKVEPLVGDMIAQPPAKAAAPASQPATPDNTVAPPLNGRISIASMQRFAARASATSR